MLNKAPNAKKSKTASAHKIDPNIIFYALLCLISLFSLAILPAKKQQDSLVCFKSCIRVEEAVSPLQRQKGLSGRIAIPGDSGMLFVFDSSGSQCMWMKDMRFDLDMVWLDQNRRIVSIAKNISPATYPETFCADNSKYVLEINSGKAAELDLNIGDSAQL